MQLRAVLKREVLIGTLQIKKKLLFFTITAVCIVAVGRGVDAEEAAQEKDTIAVQHTVLRYTQLLAEGYANMNMTSLQAAATEEQSLKVYNHMSALGEGKIRMESQLEDIEFLDTQFPDKDSAKVMTREKWNYVHESTDTKMPRQSVVEGLIYELAYDLVRQDGRWFVSSVSVLEEIKPGEPPTTDNTTFKGPDFENEGADAI